MTDSNKKRFLRFGEIPQNEKSINFFKLSFKEQSDFNWDVEMLGYDKAVSRLPQHVFEQGISCFELDEENRPVLNSIRLLTSFTHRIQDEECYFLQANKVGEGSDGEPLVRNIENVVPTKLTKEYMVNTVLEILKENFKNVVHTDDEPGTKLFNFFDSDNKPYFSFYGYKFTDCITDLDLETGIKIKKKTIQSKSR